MEKEILDLSIKYAMPYEKVMAIAINRYGIISDEIEDNRIRFTLAFNNSDEKTFFAVCVNTYSKSPFKLIGDTLYMEGKVVGKTISIEKDTCTSTYFRDNKQAITLNSNSRSKCAGCAFCGTYSLSEDDNYDFSTVSKVKNHFERILSEGNVSGMDTLKNITVCTGCFDNEQKLVEHLYTLNTAFKEMGFKGNLGYIGSQLRTYSVIDEVKKEIDDFSLLLTMEKFLERDKFMRPEKASLTLEKAHELLSYVKDSGMKATFLYILGLEDLETVKKYFTYYKDAVNKFPIIQVFQDYTDFQERYRCEEAKGVEYYLKAREIVGDIYKDTGLLPESWECFRSLNFENEYNKDCKCLTLKQ